jgi:hypothetical protein
VDALARVLQFQNVDNDVTNGSRVTLVDLDGFWLKQSRASVRIEQKVVDKFPMAVA